MSDYEPQEPTTPAAPDYSAVAEALRPMLDPIMQKVTEIDQRTQYVPPSEPEVPEWEPEDQYRQRQQAQSTTALSEAVTNKATLTRMVIDQDEKLSYEEKQAAHKILQSVRPEEWIGADPHTAARNVAIRVKGEANYTARKEPEASPATGAVDMRYFEWAKQQGLGKGMTLDQFKKEGWDKDPGMLATYRQMGGTR